MAREDLKKFRTLLLSDADFQAKIKKAAEAYTGDKSEEAVFENVLLPLAQEHGLSATYEEYKEYIGAFTDAADGELSDDELEQVAGGKGLGVVTCDSIGIGVGGVSCDDGSGGCALVGWGHGTVVCAGEGTDASQRTITKLS